MLSTLLKWTLILESLEARETGRTGRAYRDSGGSVRFFNESALWPLEVLAAIWGGRTPACNQLSPIPGHSPYVIHILVEVLGKKAGGRLSVIGTYEHEDKVVGFSVIL